MTRGSILVAFALGLAGASSCKKDAAPASEAPKSQSEPAAADEAKPATPPPPGAAAPTPAPQAAPTLGSTKEEERGDDAKGDTAVEPATLAAAESALEKAKTSLDQLVGAKGGRAAEATPLASGDPRCPEACKAMSSLRRAAAAVCRLAGDAHARCARAKGIVKDSEGKLAACKCGE